MHNDREFSQDSLFNCYLFDYSSCLGLRQNEIDFVVDPKRLVKSDLLNNQGDSSLI